MPDALSWDLITATGDDVSIYAELSGQGTVKDTRFRVVAETVSGRRHVTLQVRAHHGNTEEGRPQGRVGAVRLGQGTPRSELGAVSSGPRWGMRSTEQGAGWGAPKLEGQGARAPRTWQRGYAWFLFLQIPDADKDKAGKYSCSCVIETDKKETEVVVISAIEINEGDKQVCGV